MADQGDETQARVEPENAAQKQDKTLQKQLKELERARETGILDPWTRYRAVSDLLEWYTDLVELADRKTRFALILLGTLNAVNLIIVARPGPLGSLLAGSPPWLGGYVAIYALLSLYFFVQAIMTLRPRARRLLGTARAAAPASPTVWPGLRFIGDVAARGSDDYYDGWRQAPIGSLNREMALQVQVLAENLKVKFGALERLYSGLLFMVFLTAGLVSVVAFESLVSPR